MGGGLKPVSAYDMACCVMKGIIDRSGIDPKEIDEVIMGQCRQTSDEPNIARVAALKVGIPESASAHTVMRQCASGMTAVQNGAMQIMTGVSDVVLAGGTESMSNAVFYVRNARWGVGTGNVEFVDALTEGQFKSQPEEMYGKYNMGATAELIAQQMGITREEQDAFSIESQRRAIAAIDSGRFKDEIVPMEVPQGRKKPPVIFDTDEFPKRDTNLEKMGKLKPCFNISVAEDGRLFGSKELTGTVTAASSSGRNDGASALLLMSEEKAAELGLKPMGKIIGMGTAGADPKTMGLGPVYAVPKALKYAGLTMDDIQLIELNEAFAAQSVAVMREWVKWSDTETFDTIWERTNVNGSGISLGHPLAATGGILTTKLFYELKNRPDVRYAMVTMCIGGGMGFASIFEQCRKDG